MKQNNTIFLAKDTFKHNLNISFALAVITAAVVLLSLIPPQILRLIIDRNLLPGTMHGLALLVGIYLTIVILAGIFDFLKGCILVLFGQKLMKRIRLELNLKLQRLDMHFFTKNSAAEVTSRFTNDVDSVNSLFSDGIISMLIDSLKIIGIIISVALFSWKLALVVAAVIPLIFCITRAFQKRMLVAQSANLTQLSLVNQHISETLHNISMIKIYGKESFMESAYRKKLENNYKTIEKVNFYDSCYAPIIQVIRAVIICVVIFLSSTQINLLGISLGMVAASIDLIANLFLPIEALGMELQSIQKGFSGIKRIDDFLACEEAAAKDESLTLDALIGTGFVFQHMSFSYPDSKNPVLHDINLSIPVGSTLTFAGRTGVGKTTLFKLLMGLETPTEGTITLNGIPVARIPNKLKRQLFGYVEQSFTFVEGTVGEQISLGDETITADQIENTLVFVGLGDHVRGLDAGVDTPINSDNLFSEGQKQLLSIARAIVTNPPILLLDEITAHLDSTTEEHLLRILMKAGNGRTILSVSHRLTSILHSDRVVYLEQGEIRRISQIDPATELS
ncbi:MAG: ABC transporter ATP-binding protein [Evtepia sp.]